MTPVLKIIKGDGDRSRWMPVSVIQRQDRVAQIVAHTPLPPVSPDESWLRAIVPYAAFGSAFLLLGIAIGIGLGRVLAW